MGTEDEEAQGAGSNPIKVEISEKHVIPEAIRFDPAKSLENKPKGLVDSLTKYFHSWGQTDFKDSFEFANQTRPRASRFITPRFGFEHGRGQRGPEKEEKN